MKSKKFKYDEYGDATSTVVHPPLGKQPKSKEPKKKVVIRKASPGLDEKKAESKFYLKSKDPRKKRTALTGSEKNQRKLITKAAKSRAKY